MAGHADQRAAHLAGGRVLAGGARLGADELDDLVATRAPYLEPCTNARHGACDRSAKLAERSTASAARALGPAGRLASTYGLTHRLLGHNTHRFCMPTCTWRWQPVSARRQAPRWPMWGWSVADCWRGCWKRCARWRCGPRGGGAGWWLARRWWRCWRWPPSRCNSARSMRRGWWLHATRGETSWPPWPPWPPLRACTRSPWLMAAFSAARALAGLLRPCQCHFAVRAARHRRGRVGVGGGGRAGGAPAASLAELTRPRAPHLPLTA